MCIIMTSQKAGLKIYNTVFNRMITGKWIKQKGKLQSVKQQRDPEKITSHWFLLYLFDKI